MSAPVAPAAAKLPTRTPRSLGIYGLYGTLAGLCAVGILVYYCIYVWHRPWLAWRIPLRTTGLVLLPAALATAIAHFPSFSRHRFKALWIALIPLLFIMWQIFMPGVLYLAWFAAAALWVFTGALLVDLLLFRFNLRVPLAVSAVLFLTEVILLQYGLTARSLVRPKLLLLLAHAIPLLLCLVTRPRFTTYFRTRFTSARTPTPLFCLVLALIGSMTAFYLFVSQLPESSSDVRVYIPMLKLFAMNGGHVQKNYNPYSFYPSGWFNLFHIPWMLGGEAACKALNVLLSLFGISAVYALAVRLIRERTLALFAAFCFFTLPMFNWLWYTLYLDAAMFLFATAALLPLLDVAARTGRRSTGLIVIAGLAMGGALMIKLTPVVTFAAATSSLWLILVLRRRRSGFFRALFFTTAQLSLLGILALLICAPSVYASWHASGDPLFPMFTPLAPGIGPRAPLPNAWWARNPLTWFLWPWFATFNSWMAIDYHVNGALGPLYLMLALFLPLNLLRGSSLRRFALLFLVVFWAGMYLGHETSARYHLAFYVAALTLALAGVRIFLRDSAALHWRIWPAVLLVFACLQIFILMIYGYAVPFNFSQLRQFMRIGDRFAFNTINWPHYDDLYNLLNGLPEDTSVALTSNYGMIACQLPRYTFTFENLWTTRKLSHLGWDDPARLLSESGAALELITLSPDQPISALDFPAGAGWRTASNLVAAHDDAIAFALRPEFREPATQLDLTPNFTQTQAGEFGLQRMQQNDFQGIDIAAPAKYTGFTLIWQAPPEQELEVYEAGPGRLVRLTGSTDRDPTGQRLFLRNRFGMPLTTPTLRLRTRGPLQATTCTLAFFPQMRYPTPPRIEFTTSTLFLPTRWQGQYNQTHRIDSGTWYRNGSTTATTSTIPAAISKGQWLAYRFMGAPARRMQATLRLDVRSTMTVHLDLREESGHFINRKVEKTIRRRLNLLPGEQTITAEWPGLAERRKLTLVIWPEAKDGECTFISGVVNSFK